LFSVNATVIANCNVSASALNFGSSGLLSSSINATSTLTVDCTSGSAYNVGFDAGTATGATVTSRKMTNGTAAVNDALYSNAARTTNWGNTVGTDTVSGTGTGASQSYTVYGSVPAQTTPSPGTYIDTITVTVTY
jgi:spore coat protein U-like protein